MKDTLRELHRAEWENAVINYINRGYTKSEAQRFADENLEDKYDTDDDEDDEFVDDDESDEDETKLVRVTYTYGTYVDVVKVVFGVFFGRSMIGLVKSEGSEPTFVCVEEVEKIEAI